MTTYNLISLDWLQPSVSLVKLTSKNSLVLKCTGKQKELFEVKSESQGILDISYSYIKNKGNSAFRLTIPVKILSYNKYAPWLLDCAWITLCMYSVQRILKTKRGRRGY